MTNNDGKWVLTFAGDKTFQIELKGGLAARGTFEVAGDQLLIHDIAGNRACKAAQANGTYKWTFDGTIMKLSRVTDTCGNRAGTINGSEWTIQR